MTRVVVNQASRYAQILGASFALFACGHEPSAEHARAAALPTASVRTTQVGERTQAVGDEVVGTVRARSVAALSSSVMGTVRVLKVTVGSRVRAGDVLIQLTAGEIDAKANQANAMFAQAELELKRAEQLKATQSISSAQYDAVAAQFRVAQAALAEANVMKSYALIRAPFAGVVTDKEASVGDLALPGKPLLVLETEGVLRLEASVPEALAQALHRDESMPVRIDALGRTLTGTVSELSPSADPASRTVLVKLDLPSVPELRAGMFGRLVVHTGDEHSLVVPEGALVHWGQMETVFVVQQKHARLRIVRSGRTHDGQTEVLAGLSPDELVVTSEPARLVDGQPVEVKP